MDSINKRISIALCTYNGEAYLKEQLESIAMQTTAPYELVICDDRSTDATKDILRQFETKAHFPVKLHLNETNLGFIKNFEQAISLCNGDIIALSDQDDVWHPEKLQIVLQSFSNPNVSMVFSNATLMNEQGQLVTGSRWGLSQFTEEEQQLFARGGAYKVLHRRNAISGCTMAFLKKWWPHIRPLPEGLALIHDGWIALMTSLFGEVVMIDESLFIYRLHAEQTSTVSRQERANKKLLTGRKDSRVLRLQREWLVLETIRTRLPLCQKYIPQEKQDYLLDYIKEDQQHLKLQLSVLQGNRVGLSPILKELKSGRYHRFRRGFRSAFHDMLRQYIRSSP